MSDKTHRCIDCSQDIEHEQSELCPSCGRCATHCHGYGAVGSPTASRQTNHFTMMRVGEKPNA